MSTDTWFELEDFNRKQLGLERDIKHQKGKIKGKDMSLYNNINHSKLDNRSQN